MIAAKIHTWGDEIDILFISFVKVRIKKSKDITRIHSAPLLIIWAIKPYNGNERNKIRAYITNIHYKFKKWV